MMDKHFLSFEKISRPKNRKTDIYKVINNDYYLLGYVKWYSPWRKYCFWTTDESIILSTECLIQIHYFVNDLMIKRKMKNNG